MKKQLLFALALTMTAMASAKDIQVKTFRYAGPFDVPRPVLLDSVDAQQRPFTRRCISTWLKMGSSFPVRSRPPRPLPVPCTCCSSRCRMEPIAG